jgi:hypothetical protein
VILKYYWIGLGIGWRCDIHTIAEVKVDGRWQVNQEKIFPNSSYRSEPRHNWEKDEFETQPEDIRHYDWFAVVANVCNGHGFAGVGTGEGLNAIAEPRGLPDDASQDFRKALWDFGLFAVSWLNISDFDKFDWDAVAVKERGICKTR